MLEEFEQQSKAKPGWARLVGNQFSITTRQGPMFRRVIRRPLPSHTAASLLLPPQPTRQKKYREQPVAALFGLQ
jgi:hypothetical protein